MTAAPDATDVGPPGGDLPVGPLVVLCGPMGSGKSSVGAVLARRHGVGLRDTDADVERAAGRTIAEIFATDGEAAFRLLEHQAVLAALAAHDGVLALGGGAVLHAGTREALTRYAAGGGTVVLLEVSADAVAERVRGDTARPLLAGDARARWVALAEQRRPVYAAVATHRVDTDGATPDAVAARVEDALAARARRDGRPDPVPLEDRP